MQFRAEAVTQIYVGKDKVCRCGCKGSYAQRGESKFTQRLKQFEKLLDGYTFSQGDVGGDYLNISYGNDRAITVYFG